MAHFKISIAQNKSDQTKHSLLQVEKDGKPEYVSVAVPPDFADYLLDIAKNVRNAALEEAAAYCKAKEDGCGEPGCKCYHGRHLATGIRFLKG